MGRRMAELDGNNDQNWEILTGERTRLQSTASKFKALTQQRGYASPY